MKAYILINVRPGSIAEVVRNLRRLKGVDEANMTFGLYDVVAILNAKDLNHLGQLVAMDIQPIPGIQDTLTCLVGEI